VEHIPRGLPPLTVARWLPPGAALPDMLVVAVTITLVGHVTPCGWPPNLLAGRISVLSSDRPATGAQTLLQLCECHYKVGLMESTARLCRSIARVPLQGGADGEHSHRQVAGGHAPPRAGPQPGAAR